jgi:hypothetical protein
MSGDKTEIRPEVWGNFAQMPPPPLVTPDTPAAGPSAADNAATATNMAALLGDPKDNADAQKGHAERSAAAADAAAQFPANEEETSGQMKGVEQSSQMAQQLPQMASSLAGAVAGALGGVLQPLGQIPQQLAQTGQQLLQQGMGAMQQKGEGELNTEDLAGEGLGSDLGGGDPKLGEGGGGSGGGGVGGIGSTTPTAMLGPPATPSGSTTPTSGRAAMPPVTPAAAPAATTTSGGMGGMGAMPHGGMHGGGESKDEKPGTKRVAVPSIKNGAPVQGRIATPPTPPTVTKKVDGKTVSSKRIVIPSDRANDKSESDDDKGR